MSFMGRRISLLKVNSGMKRVKSWILLAIIAVVALFPSCGGGGGGTPSLQRERLSPPSVPQTSSPTDLALPTRNALIAQMPVLGAIPIGSEFDFILKGEFKDELFQASLRIIYDEAVVKPIRVERGNFIPESAVFFSKMDRPGLIPIAFTRLPGESGLLPGRGELVKVRFRLNSLPPAHFRVRILNEPAFLQLRDKNRGRLSFDLATEVTSQ